MKVNGTTHPLSGQGAGHPGSYRRSPVAPEVRPAVKAALPRPPAARHARAVPERRRQLTLLSLVASAALLGCSSLPSAPWRVEPAFRIANGGDSGNAAQGYLALARQYEGEERLAQALEAYRKAALAAPADAEVQNTLGVALARHAQYGPAVLALRRAVALAPERAPLLNNLGYALLLDGHAEDARAMFRLTLAVEPTHGPAQHNLAYVDQQLATAAAKAAPVAVAQAAVPAAVAQPVTAASPVVNPLPPVAAVTAVTASTAVQAPQAAPAPAAAAVSAAPPTLPSAAAPVAPAPPAAAAVVASAAAAAPTVVHAGLGGLSIEIVNGNGINGAAARLRELLRERGVEVGRLANRLPYDSPQTRVFYRPGKVDAAMQLVRRMPVGAEVGPAAENSMRADLSVLLGHDVRKSAGCALLAACEVPNRLVASADRPEHVRSAEGSARP